MSLFDSSLTTSGLFDDLETTLTLNRYPEKTGANKGIMDWTATPTAISSSVVCSEPQIASVNAQQQAGLEFKAGRLEVISDPITPSPETDRLVINSVSYTVVGIAWNDDSSHTHIIIESV